MHSGGRKDGQRIADSVGSVQDSTEFQPGRNLSDLRRGRVSAHAHRDQLLHRQPRPGRRHVGRLRHPIPVSGRAPTKVRRKIIERFFDISWMEVSLSSILSAESVANKIG